MKFTEEKTRPPLPPLCSLHWPTLCWCFLFSNFKYYNYVLRTGSTFSCLHYDTHSHSISLQLLLRITVEAYFTFNFLYFVCVWYQSNYITNEHHLRNKETRWHSSSRSNSDWVQWETLVSLCPLLCPCVLGLVIFELCSGYRQARQGSCESSWFPLGVLGLLCQHFQITFAIPDRTNPVWRLSCTQFIFKLLSPLSRWCSFSKAVLCLGLGLQGQG